MTEKDYYAKIAQYYTRTARRPMAIEVKITKNGLLNYSALRPHQEQFLLQSERTFAHKIPDVGMLKKPYDIILVHDALAVVVIVFYNPRRSKVYQIPVREFIRARHSSFTKSLSEAQAAQIGILIHL